jgi:hypothetical protein
MNSDALTYKESPSLNDNHMFDYLKCMNYLKDTDYPLIPRISMDELSREKKCNEIGFKGVSKDLVKLNKDGIVNDEELSFLLKVAFAIFLETEFTQMLNKTSSRRLSKFYCMSDYHV